MKLVKNLSPDHKKYLSEKSNFASHQKEIYKSSFDEIEKQAYYIDDLLKDVDGYITINFSGGNSFSNYDLNVTYNEIVFKINPSNYPKKDSFSYSIPESFKFQNMVSRYNKPEFDKPKNYTFYKLTQKKIIECFDYQIKVYEWYKKESEIQLIEQKKVYDLAIGQLKVLSKVFDEKLRLSENSASLYISNYYTFKLNASWDQSIAESNVSSDIAMLYNLVFEVKKHFTQR